MGLELHWMRLSFHGEYANRSNTLRFRQSEQGERDPREITSNWPARDGCALSVTG